MPNPYRQPKPRRSEQVGRLRVYGVDERGRRNTSIGQVILLTHDHIWVSEAESIPLASILETSVTDRAGRIMYADTISGDIVEFAFTVPGLFRPKVRKIRGFLDDVDRVRVHPTREADGGTQALVDRSTVCERCGEPAACAIVLREFRFVGIAPIAYSYRILPLRFVVCSDCAGPVALRVNSTTALLGYLGFPGLVAAPYYILRNLFTLQGYGLATSRDWAASLVVTVLLPTGIWTAAIFAIVRAAN